MYTSTGGIAHNHEPAGTTDPQEMMSFLQLSISLGTQRIYYLIRLKDLRVLLSAFPEERSPVPWNIREAATFLSPQQDED